MAVRLYKYLLSDQTLRVAREDQFIREVQALSPVDNLSVGVVLVLGAEWWPADKTFEHDGTDRPPIAEISVSLAVENFGSDIVRSSNRGIGHGTAGLTPGVDLATVRHCKVNGIVKVSRVAIPVLGSRVLEKILVISVVVSFLASGRETEVSKLDMTTTVEQNVVGLDITAQTRVVSTRGRRKGYRWTNAPGMP